MSEIEEVLSRLAAKLMPEFSDGATASRIWWDEEAKTLHREVVPAEQIYCQGDGGGGC